MRPLAGLLFVLALAPSRADASIARDPIRRVIHASVGEIRECMARHEYGRGIYVVQFEIDGTGKVARVEMVSGPSEPTPAAQSCMEAVFTRMHFLGYRPVPSEPLPVRTDGRRASRVPRDLRHSRRAGRIIVRYPLRLLP